jgi:hypothetical protein
MAANETAMPVDQESALLPQPPAATVPPPGVVDAGPPPSARGAATAADNVPAQRRGGVLGHWRGNAPQRQPTAIEALSETETQPADDVAPEYPNPMLRLMAILVALALLLGVIALGVAIAAHGSTPTPRVQAGHAGPTGQRGAAGSRGRVGPQGAQGLTGPAGPAGPAGAAGRDGTVAGATEISGAPVATAPNPYPGTSATATASCPAGSFLLSGGGQATAPVGGGADVALESSAPLNATTWQAIGAVVNSMPSGDAMTVRAWVVCGTTPPTTTTTAKTSTTP